MRLLIGSDGPAWLGQQADIRAWTQRVVWFAEDCDAIVLMDAPDRAFVEHVARLTGIDPSTLRFHVMPSRWTGGNFDAWSLLDRAFQDELERDAAAATEVLTLWPCSEVGWLAKSYGIDRKLPGAAFFREGGGILANSKVLFRSIAGGTGVLVPPGGVCRSPEDAYRLSGYLLAQSNAFMVKRCYGGGGKGNEFVATERLSVSHAGHTSAETIEVTPESLHAYWERRWGWASCDGSHPVVVEAFVPDARTLYVEVFCGDDGGAHGKVGELKFNDGEIAYEIFPAQDVPSAVWADLQRGGNRLSQAYKAAGYRGFLSLDSVVTADGRVFFTEANARFTSSTHLHDRIASKVARIAEPPDRVLVQMQSPRSWQLQDLREFFQTMARHELAFDSVARRGILAVTPVVHSYGQLMLVAVAENETAAISLFDSANRAVLQSNER